MNLILVAVLLTLAAAINATHLNPDGSAPTEKWRTTETAGQEARDKLLDDLFQGYKTYSYPDNATVRFGVSLLTVDLDEANNQMVSSSWFKYSWIDKRLIWDAKERGVNVLRVPSNLVWKPDVTLYNSANQNKRLSCWDSNVIVYPTGQVLWVPPCHQQTYCNLTLDHDPYKEQVCILKFGSWTFDGLTMGLDFFQNEKFVNINDFTGSNRFKITTNTASRNEKFYDCCVEPYIDLTYTLGLTQIDHKNLKCDGKN